MKEVRFQALKGTQGTTVVCLSTVGQLQFTGICGVFQNKMTLRLSNTPIMSEGNGNIIALTSALHVVNTFNYHTIAS